MPAGAVHEVRERRVDDRPRCADADRERRARDDLEVDDPTDPEDAERLHAIPSDACLRLCVSRKLMIANPAIA